jgi:predicted nucleic acid-binding protein
MAQYLLGENTLIDLCYNDTPSQKWLNSVASTELYTSVIAVAAARETIGALASSAKARDRQLLNLQQVLARLKADGMTILPFEQEHADEWANWRVEPLAVSRGDRVEEAPQDTRMIIATATVRGLCLVEPFETYHASLQTHGLKVLSL